VQLTDVTSDTCDLQPDSESDALLDQLGAGANHLPSPAGADGSCEVRVAVGSGLAIPGYTLIAPENALRFEQYCPSWAVPLGERVWEQLRIEQGRPAPTKN